MFKKGDALLNKKGIFIWEKVFKKGPSKIYGTQHLKKFIWSTLKCFVPFFTRFSNFQDANHLLYYPQMSVLTFHTIVVFLYQFLRHGAKKEC